MRRIPGTVTVAAVAGGLRPTVAGYFVTEFHQSVSAIMRAVTAPPPPLIRKPTQLPPPHKPAALPPSHKDPQIKGSLFLPQSDKCSLPSGLDRETLAPAVAT
jgi:hypothetical protein